MAFDKAKAFLDARGFGDRVQTFEVSSATVQLAALALGTEEARIAKSLTYLVAGQAVMVICAGDARVSNPKFKAFFHEKARMLTREQVTELVGHEVGGVCPFGIRPECRVYLDESLRRFDIIYPACGSDNSAVQLTPDELARLTGAPWIDVCGPTA